MEIFKVIYMECEKLGNTFGFGAFEGGVIYFAVFSILLIKIIDSIKKVYENKKSKKKIDLSPKTKVDEIDLKIKVIK
ncbi:MAG: hypothetical protein ACRC57_04435 [Sarcina sp.]